MSLTLFPRTRTTTSLPWTRCSVLVVVVVVFINSAPPFIPMKKPPPLIVLWTNEGTIYHKRTRNKFNYLHFLSFPKHFVPHSVKDPLRDVLVVSFRSFYLSLFTFISPFPFSFKKKKNIFIRATQQQYIPVCRTFPFSVRFTPFPPTSHLPLIPLLSCSCFSLQVTGHLLCCCCWWSVGRATRGNL